MIKIYKRWDWEHDEGVELIVDHNKLPNEHAIVYYDYRNLIYRVTVKVKTAVIGDDTIETNVYDYYYDDKKRLVEKRSLDEHGNVCLIVHFRYEKGIKVEEIGWNPNSNSPPTVYRVRN